MLRSFIAIKLAQFGMMLLVLCMLFSFVNFVVAARFTAIIVFVAFIVSYSLRIGLDSDEQN